MKRKFSLLVMVLLCLALVAGTVLACTDDETTPKTPVSDSSAYAGRYYEIVNGKISDSLWIELDDDWGWIDDGDAFGTFTVDDEGKIELYWLVASEPAFSGTIEDGKMTLTIFYQEVEYVLQEDKNAEIAA